MKKRQGYLFDQGLIDRIKQMKEKLHTNSDTAIVIQAINEMYRKHFPNYTSIRTPITPEQRAQNHIDTEKHKQKVTEDAFLAIVEAIDGVVEVGTGGNKMVRYYTYNKGTRMEQKRPLDAMNDEIISSQYFPSKEDVMARRERGEVDY